MTNSSAAYDFDRFTDTSAYAREKVAAKKKAEIKPVASSERKINPVKIFLAAAVVLAVTCAMIYNQVVLIELGDQQNKLQESIEIIEAENIRKTTELESKMSLKNIEEYATETLGYVKLDSSKISYVNLSDKNKIEIKSENSGGIFDKIGDFINGIMEYLK